MSLTRLGEGVWLMAFNFMKFTDLDIHDPNWAQKFTDKWFDKCKDLNVKT